MHGWERWLAAVVRLARPSSLKHVYCCWQGAVARLSRTGAECIAPACLTACMARFVPHAGSNGRAVRPCESGKHLPGGAAGRGRCAPAAVHGGPPFAHARRVRRLQRPPSCRPPTLCPARPCLAAGPVPQPFLLRAAAAFITRILSGMGQCGCSALWPTMAERCHPATLRRHPQAPACCPAHGRSRAACTNPDPPGRRPAPCRAPPLVQCLAWRPPRETSWALQTRRWRPTMMPCTLCWTPSAPSGAGRALGAPSASANAEACQWLRRRWRQHCTAARLGQARLGHAPNLSLSNPI